MTDAVTVSLRHLLALQMVAKHRNFSRAAEAVHLTQPAISLAIAKLEAQVGTALFERHNAGTFLTDAGRLLARRVDRMFQQIEDTCIAAEISLDGAPSYAALSVRITRSQLRALTAIASGDLENSDYDISRASVLRAARELELSLGKRLMRQDARGLVLTHAGSLLAERLTVALREIDYGFEDIFAETGRQRGELRVGAMPMSGSFLLAPVLNDVTQAYPEASFEVMSGDSGQLKRALQRGEIDFIVGMLCDNTPRENIASEEIMDFPYVLVARPGHPLAQRQGLKPEDLDGFHWIAPNPQTARRRAFDSLVARMRQPPSANIQASSLQTVQLLLSGSDRLALLTRFEVEQQRGAGTLVVLPLHDIAPTHSIGIMRRANWEPTSMQRAFIDLLRRHAQAFSERYEPPQPERAIRRVV